MSGTRFLLTGLGPISPRRRFDMIEFLKTLFKSDPTKKVLKERDQLYKKAVQLQRNGDLREYGKVMARIQELEKEYVRLSTEEAE